MLSRRHSGHRSLRVTKLLGTDPTVGGHAWRLVDHCAHSQSVPARNTSVNELPMTRPPMCAGRRRRAVVASCRGVEAGRACGRSRARSRRRSRPRHREGTGRAALPQWSRATPSAPEARARRGARPRRRVLSGAFRQVDGRCVRAQVPAVVAMQFTAPQEVTRAFAAEFYRTLAEGFPIDACVTEGRKAIIGATGLRRPDWGIPVIYTRAPDGNLFEFMTYPPDVT